jgi:hypothetical protein
MLRQMEKSTYFLIGKSFFRRSKIGFDSRLGHPSTSKSDGNVENISNLLRNDLLLTFRMIAEELNINRATIRLILTENLEVKKVCAMIVLTNFKNTIYSGRGNLR